MQHADAMLQLVAIKRLYHLGLTEAGCKVPAYATGRMTMAGLAALISTEGPYEAGLLAAAAGIPIKDAVKAAGIAKQYLGYIYKETTHGKQRAERPEDRAQQEAPLPDALRWGTEG